MIKAENKGVFQMKKILFTASECVPFIKTGGLADVIGSLPGVIDREKFEVRVMIPAYTIIPEQYRSRMKTVCCFMSYFNGRDRYVGVKELVKDGIIYDFIDNEEYFGGGYPYTDYYYDIEKFCFFCKAVLSVLPSLGFRPDIIHCNDWHTGLIPVYLKTEFAGDPFYQGIRSIMTVHNLKFQGLFNAKDMSRISGLPMELFTIDKLLTYDDGNMLKGGLVYADVITTVSETYAEEIKTPEYGEGLDGIFRAREKEFCGIVNGIDDVVFDPAADNLIPHRYNRRSMLTGKTKNKLALQRQLGLEENDSVMMFGIVSRLTEQKGMELISLNLITGQETEPVIWRAPIVSQLVQQFWSEVIWGDLDYLLVDMPPGTGDVPLTVFQSLPVEGVIVVTSPQSLVNMIVKKAYNMAKLMNIPVLGIVENMSYVICPDCGKKIYAFGEGKSEKTAEELGLPLLAQIPVNPETATLVDKGEVEKVSTEPIEIALKKIEEILG